MVARFFGHKVGPFFVWQVIVLLVVAGGSATAALTLPEEEVVTRSSALAEGEQLVAARIGTLVDSISTSGSVVFPVRETAAFDVAGTVGEVYVTEGSTVNAGDVVARLDAATMASFEREVADARFKLRNAQDALDEALEGTDAVLLKRAQDAVVQRRAALASSQSELALKKKDIREEEQEASQVIADAEAAYASEFDQWLGIPVENVDVTRNPDAQLRRWGIDLDVLFDDRGSIRQESRLYVPRDDPETPWNEFTLYFWTRLFPGPVMGDCEDEAPYQGECVSLEMDLVWDALVDARDAMEPLLVRTARELLTAEENLAKAEDALEDAEQAVIDVIVEIDSLEVTLLTADITVAEHALAAAEVNLTVDVLLAPIDGIVETVEISPGDAVGQQGGGQQSASIGILDPSVVEIDGLVDEIDVLAVDVGVVVQVALSALGGQTLDGRIDSIGEAIEGQSGVVTFPITVRLDVPSGLTLREGLSATSQVVLEEYANVLLAPTSAIAGSIVVPTVRVFSAGIIEERRVTLGPSDDFWVIILDGLEEGEQVVIPEPASANMQFGGFGAVFGGGFAGRGPGPRGGGG